MSRRSRRACANDPEVVRDSDVEMTHDHGFEGENVMTRPFRPTLIITSLALLTGCISGPPLQTVVITSPSKRLAIYGVRTYQHEKGVLVRA